MKKLLWIVMLLVVILAANPALAASTHIVRFEGAEPVTISDEFPQYPEDGPFRFRLMAAIPIGDRQYVLIGGVSTSDPSYQMILLFMNVDDKVYLIAAATASHKNGKSVNKKCYRDESFFRNGTYSGMLIKTEKFPGPSEIEQIPSGNKVQKIRI